MTDTNGSIHPSDVLVHAGNLLREVGHAKGTGMNNEGAMCSIGAIDVASVILDASDEVTLVAAQTLEKTIPSLFGSVPSWNDALATTTEEVLTTFNDAARKALLVEKGLAEEV